MLWTKLRQWTKSWGYIKGIHIITMLCTTGNWLNRKFIELPWCHLSVNHLPLAMTFPHENISACLTSISLQLWLKADWFCLKMCWKVHDSSCGNSWGVRAPWVWETLVQNTSASSPQGGETLQASISIPFPSKALHWITSLNPRLKIRKCISRWERVGLNPHIHSLLYSQPWNLTKDSRKEKVSQSWGCWVKQKFSSNVSETETVPSRIIKEQWRTKSPAKASLSHSSVPLDKRKSIVAVRFTSDRPAHEHSSLMPWGCLRCPCEQVSLARGHEKPTAECTALRGVFDLW